MESTFLYYKMLIANIKRNRICWFEVLYAEKKSDRLY